MNQIGALRLHPGGPVDEQLLTWLAGALLGQPEPAPPSLLAALPSLGIHGILPLLYVRLRDASALATLPAPLAGELAGRFQNQALRTQFFEVAIEEIARAFDAASCPLMLLKGAAAGRLLYGSPAERPIGDLDLLVPAGRVDEARAVAMSLGYVPIAPEMPGPLARWRRRFRAETQLVGAVEGKQRLLLELHWALVEIPYYIERIPASEIWAAAQPATGLPGTLLPDPATLLVHTCAHLALHHSQEVRLIWLLDVDLLARWPVIEWEAVLQRCSKWGLALATRAVLGAARAWLATPVPDEVLGELDALAEEPSAGAEAAAAMWGLGDERPGRAWRRALATWRAFTPAQRARYASWLGFRVALLPGERAMRRKTPPTEQKSGR